MSSYFLALRRQAKRHRAAVLSVMCVVVFATTYALILPAITIDQRTAENEPGISIASSSSAGNQDNAASPNTKADKQEKAAPQEAKAAAKTAQSTDAKKVSGAKEKGAASGDGKTSSDSEDKAAAAKLTVNKNGYQVTVDYGKDADIAKGAVLSVKEYAKDSDEYKAARQKVIKAKKAAGEKVDKDALGFAAFDISILDKDGNKVEPAQGAKVSVKLSADNLPKRIKAKSLQVQHIKDSASDDVETVADAANTDKNTVSLDGTTAKANFTVDSFSTFTLTYYAGFWGSTFKRIRVVDENGDSLGSDKSQPLYWPSSSESLSNLANNANPDSSVYTFAQARVGSSFANAAGNTFTSGTIGYDDGWYYSNDRTADYFGSDDILYLVYEPKTVTLAFSQNGGSGSRPSSITGKAGDAVTLPTYNGTRNGYTFLGWTDTPNLMGDTSYHEVYPAGSEYVLPSRDITLYAAWSNNNGISRSDFYVQLGGTIPTEPGSHSVANYTKGITINNNVKDKRWIIDTAWTSVVGANAQNNVTANLNSLPSVDQLAADINKSSDKLGFTVKNSGGELVVASITNSKTNEHAYNVSAGDALYVLWYVQKLQPTSGVRGNTWHIDGVLLVKNKVTITYVKNTDSVVNNMPRGYQTPQDTHVTIGADGSPDGTVMTPTRTGYNFLGWNTTSDGSGTWYYNNTNHTMAEDFTLYAQWDRKTTGITVYKVDSNNTSTYLGGATFRLTKKGENNSYQAVTVDGVTDENGDFTISERGARLTGLDDGDYMLTELSAPAGYVVTDSSVKFTVSDGVAQNFGSIADNAWLVNNNRLTIKNTPGSPLPNTGGGGAWTYSAAGAALVLLAVIGGFVLRRRNHGKGGC